MTTPGAGEAALLVATDLDGCLLDETTYEFEPARPALAELAGLDLATGRRTPVRTIETPDAAGIRSAFPTITPDGKHWAVSTSRLLSELFVVEGLR